MKLLDFFDRFRRDEKIGAVLARGVSAAFLVAVLSNIAGMGIQILIARLMGRTQFSAFLYIWTWINLLAAFAVAGWDIVMLRFLSTYKAEEEWGLLRGVYRRGRQATLATAIVLASVAAVVACSVGDGLDDGLRSNFLLGCTLIPLLVLLRLSAAAFRALREVIVADLPDALVRPALVLASLAVAVHAGMGTASAGMALALQWPAAALAYFLAHRLLAWRMPREAIVAEPAYRSKQWVRVALPTIWMTIVQTGMNRSDVLLLGIFQGAVQGGTYAIAVQLARLINFGLGAVLSFLPPVIAQLYSQGRKEELQHALTLTARGLLIFTIPVFLTLVVAGKLLLGLYGPGFALGYTAMLILAFGQLADVFGGPNNTIMLMTGHERESAMILSATAVMNLALNVMLIPKYGMLGAAIASALSAATWNLILVVFVSRRLGLHVNILGPLFGRPKASSLVESRIEPLINTDLHA